MRHKIPAGREVTAARRERDGIFMSEFEQGEISFRKAFEFGLEGLVSG
jgi:hypothetical protein